MRLTNRLSLPQPLVDAVANDGYTKGAADISVTELLKPPRIRVLEQKHAEEIEEDASGRVWSLMGQTMHTVLERANRTGIAERRLSIEVEGWRISGGMDHYDATVIEGATLTDYKLTSVFKFKGDKVDPGFEAQLNIYAEMLRQHGERIDRLQLVGILRDWRRAELKENRKRGFSDYPDQDVVKREVRMWLPAEAQKFIRDRVILHKQALVEIPICTAEDRWMRGEAWAVKRAGRKIAEKGGVHSTEAAAQEHAKQIPDALVEYRPGENIRCDSYCRVSRFCTQYAALQAAERSEWEKPLVLGQDKTG